MVGKELEATTVTGVITYPCQPPPKHQSGRRLDDVHWDKVKKIFPKENIPANNEDSELLLDDSSEKKSVQIMNGRKAMPTLDEQGFTLLQNVPTKVTDFGDSESVEQIYLPEVVKAIKSAIPNVKTVVPFHWIVLDSRRNNYDSSKGPVQDTFKGKAASTVSRVHGDYTAENGPVRFDELQAEGLLPQNWDRTKEHWAIMNVWRNIRGEPVSTKPLTMLDVSSCSPSDVFQYWLVNQNSIGRNLALSYNQEHRWMYFPLMTNQEALLFFTFECNGEATRLVFHTAFDPVLEESSNKDRVRISVATRCLVVFDTPQED